MQGNLSAWLIKHGIVYRSLGFDYQGIDFTNKARGLAFDCCYFICIWLQLSTFPMCL